MKILVARPDVTVPLHVLLLFFVGAMGVIGAAVWYVVGTGSICKILPVVSAGCALVAVLPWKLRRAQPSLRGARTALVLLGFSALCLLTYLRCRV